jgi:hypothetical protein
MGNVGGYSFLLASYADYILSSMEGAEKMIADILIFFAGAFCGSVVMAFFIGARILNAKCDEWERRY